MLGLLLAFTLLMSKGTSSSSSSSPASLSWVVRFSAANVVGEITLLPRPRWTVRRGSSLIASGAAELAEDTIRPMLEAFAAATQGMPVVGQLQRDDGVLTVSVFGVANTMPERWTWTLTDGEDAVTGFAPTRGVAILDAVDRAAMGPG